MEYMEIKTAHQLVNHGPVVLLCSSDGQGQYDVAPIAWNCPVHKEPPKVLVVIGKRHKSWENIVKQGEFIVAVPHRDQVELVRNTGSISGADVDKFAKFGIRGFKGEKVDAMVPEGVIGYIECKVFKRVDVDPVEMIIGEVLRAAVNEQAYNERLLTELPEGKTLHHLGGQIFTLPADEVLGKE